MTTLIGVTTGIRDFQFDTIGRLASGNRQLATILHLGERVTNQAFDQRSQVVAIGRRHQLGIDVQVKQDAAGMLPHQWRRGAIDQHGQ